MGAGATGIPATVASEINLIRHLAPGADEADLEWLARLMANPDLAVAQGIWARGPSVPR